MRHPETSTKMEHSPYLGKHVYNRCGDARRVPVADNRRNVISLCEYLNAGALDEYALGRIYAEGVIQVIEEHLLVCSACQDALEATMTLMAALKASSVSLEKPEGRGNW
jgi:hypothetical protein